MVKNKNNHKEKKRPDIIFLIELIIFSIFSISALQIINYYNKEQKPYTEEELNDAKQLNINSFSVEQTAKIDLEIKSLENFKDYFKYEPYTAESSGINTLLQSAVMLPIVMFFLIFVLPPIVLSYILWFIIKYYKQVFTALIEFIRMIFDYATAVVEGMLASKWWIRKFTHWHRRSPTFSHYFDKWRIKYVDRPIYN